MNKPVLPFCETMIAYSCNLSCLGCTNYSDYATKGYVPWSEGCKWLENWLERIEIPDFGIIGGEPLLNPDAKNWIKGCRELMPQSQIRFTTNAVLLAEKTSILDTLMSIGNCVIKVSVHQPHEFYTQKAIKLLFDLSDWEPVSEHGINRWIDRHGNRLQINFPKTFVKSYKGNLANMLPHFNDPTRAFEVCVQQRCPLLYEQTLYKCSTSALLKKVLTDWKREKILEWQPYLKYPGISPDCDIESLLNFIKTFGQPEWICEMCPSSKDFQSHVDHLDNVITKHDWIKIYG